MSNEVKERAANVDWTCSVNQWIRAALRMSFEYGNGLDPNGDQGSDFFLKPWFNSKLRPDTYENIVGVVSENLTVK